MGLSSTAQQVMLLILVISLHKLFAAFAVGMSFLSAEFSRQRYLTLILFFSLMAPLGIILGGLATSQFETSLTLRAEAVFDALAAGTYHLHCNDRQHAKGVLLQGRPLDEFRGAVFRVRLDGHAVVWRIRPHWP